MFTNQWRFNSFILFAIFCCLALPVQAAEEKDSSLKGWRKTRAEIFARIEREVKEQVDATVTLESTAATLNIQLPLLEPEKSVEEIFAETRKEAEKTALTARPLKELQKIVQEAEQNFPLYQIGDQVSVRTRIKTNPVASGIVGAISPDRVQIGSRWIPVKDIAEEQRAAFDAVKTQDLRQNFAAKQNNLQMAILSNATETNFLKALPENMRKGGYYAASNIPTELVKPGNWVPGKVVLQQELARLRKEAAAKLHPEIEQQRFAENHFKYYANKKEWRPAGVLQSLKNLFE